ncbi:dimethylmenaquinone methyltransferase [Longibacter salinarum]|uniref:Dimethylmenaquinone methyltransferase n=1 Tax=Longibacter salinarum TaxID=1850348 RepID=A0A2A8CUS7_9BACT|nr:methyltransferase domain-containing protein [Longibacter salinarum]PEN12214.1 dimethylmenaquinone methyltransferase [Longibacter salinarum]
MKDNVQRRVQRYGWDQAARDYDPCWQRPLKPAQDELLEQAALRPGQHVLDVACGTGLVTLPAADAVAPGGEVVATDISAGMIEQARALARERGIGNVTFERMDAEALEWTDRAPGSASGPGFDAALCSLGLMYVPDPEQALREMHRVLAPGGRAVASVWGARSRCGWSPVFPIVDRRVQSDVCPLFFRLGTGTALEAAFRAAGFTDVTSDRFRTMLPFESKEDACRAIFEGGPVALAWRTFDEETREGASAEYLDAIGPYREEGGYAIPGEFVITRGRKRAR